MASLKATIDTSDVVDKINKLKSLTEDLHKNIHDMIDMYEYARESIKELSGELKNIKAEVKRN